MSNKFSIVKKLKMSIVTSKRYQDSLDSLFDIFINNDRLTIYDKNSYRNEFIKSIEKDLDDAYQLGLKEGKKENTIKTNQDKEELL